MNMKKSTGPVYNDEGELLDEFDKLGVDPSSSNAKSSSRRLHSNNHSSVKMTKSSISSVSLEDRFSVVSLE
jgi:hypothetical protein